MRASRVVTAALALSGIVLSASSPACSSSTGSFFASGDGGLEASSDVTVSSPDGHPADARPSQDAPGSAHDAPPTLLTLDASAQEASVITEAGFNDAELTIDTGTCDPDAGPPGPGPVQHLCILYPSSGDSDNECDGHHDPVGFPALANGSGGNGFDDNCNGLVDEGCSCNDVGTTKTCYLVPGSQQVNGVPVGWCAENSKGTVACSQKGEASPTWSGQCRGAELPFATDFCAPGDFNCDGKEENSTTQNCGCTSGIVACPTEPLLTSPYPPIHALPLKVDAAAWFVNPADVAMATGWSWSLSGGDCDDILPHPTFSIFATSVAAGMTPVGTQSSTLGTSGLEHGWVATSPAVTSSIYPAFSLSGDYLLKASWTLNGTPYSCSVKVEVRAPGVRAEGCWDTEAEGDDLDLHLAKINDFAQCATSHSWSDLVAACATANEDCYYGDCYTGGISGSMNTTNWGYAKSPASSCTGWGSQSLGATSCNNPRLDRDANGLSGTCDPNVKNPNGVSAIGPYCGPENINVDHPENNDRFAVGLRFYSQSGTTNPHGHVNVYCDGVRVLSSGYDPTTGNAFPQLISPGEDSTGDMWKVGIVTTQVTGAGLTCTVVPTQSQNPDPLRDGSSAYCVDDYTFDGALSQELLTSSGLEPANADALCYH